MNADIIGRFQRSIDSLRDLAQIIGQRNREERTAFLSTAVAPIVIDIDPTLALHAAASKGEQLVTLTTKADNKKHLDITVTSVGEFASTLRAFSELLQASRRNELLLNGALISLASAMEDLFEDTLVEFFSHHPSALGDDASLTLKELKEVATISEAVEYLVRKKVDGIIREDFESWMSCLHNHTKVDLKHISPHMPALVEIFQRRNLLVHCGGKVNRVYLSKVPELVRQGINEGDSLHVDDKYLSSSLNLAEQQLTLFAAELWKRERPSDSTRGGLMLDLVLGSYLVRNTTPPSYIRASACMTSSYLSTSR